MGEDVEEKEDAKQETPKVEPKKRKSQKSPAR